MKEKNNTWLSEETNEPVSGKKRGEKIVHALVIILLVVYGLACLFDIFCNLLPSKALALTAEAMEQTRTQGIESISEAQVSKIKAYTNCSIFLNKQSQVDCKLSYVLLAEGMKRWNEIKSEGVELETETKEPTQKEVVHIDSGLDKMMDDLLAPNDDPGPGPGPVPDVTASNTGLYMPVFSGTGKVFLVDTGADLGHLRSTDFPSYSEYARYEDDLKDLLLYTSVQPLARIAETGEPISSEPAGEWAGPID